MTPYQCHICICQSNTQGVNIVVYSTVRIHNQHTLQKLSILYRLLSENSEDTEQSAHDQVLHSLP